MRKPDFFQCESKGADLLRSNAFVFAKRIVQFLHFLNPEFSASSHLLCLHSSVCVTPAENPEDRFSRVAAQFSTGTLEAA